MADIQFVLEQPHTVQSQKKRPRLVTSCDNCRLKKVKCIQHSPNEKCEACANASVACRFRDRERYFAERSRIMAGTSPDTTRRSAQPSRASSSSTGWNSSNGTPSPDRDVAPTIVPSNATARYTEFSMGSSYMPSWSEYPQSTSVASPYTSQASNSLNSTHWDYGSVPHYSADASSSPSTHFGVDYPSQPSSQSPQTPLFDPRCPDQPHANLMTYFIQAFFDNLSSYFPFMSYEATVSQFLNQTMSPVLSSCIAALAARYVDCPEVTSLGVTNLQAAYCSNAERLLASQASSGFPTTLDTLHATILLAWAEYKRNRGQMFCFHAQTAGQMAWTLGITNETAMALAQNEMEHTMYKSTQQCVSQLTATASQMSIVPPIH